MPIEEDGGRKMVDKVKRAFFEKYWCGEVQGILRRSKRVVAGMTNGDGQRRFRESKAGLDLFGHGVMVRVEKVYDTSAAVNAFEGIDGTTGRVDELRRQQKQWMWVERFVVVRLCLFLIEALTRTSIDDGCVE